MLVGLKPRLLDPGVQIPPLIEAAVLLGLAVICILK